LTIVRYQQSLMMSYETLEQRVADRTAALEAAHRQLQDFTIRLDRGVEEERERISREVHDQLGQVFTGLRMNLLLNVALLPAGYREQADA
ncbi:histidine kinase, partial [Acinetobacter baumannii]